MLRAELVHWIPARGIHGHRTRTICHGFRTWPFVRKVSRQNLADLARRFSATASNSHSGDIVMLKFVATLSLAASLVTTTARAEAASSCGSGCGQCPAPATSTASSQPSAERVTQGTRSFSYEPAPPRAYYRSSPQSRGWSGGVRGAGSKVLGQY